LQIKWDLKEKKNEKMRAGGITASVTTHQALIVRILFKNMNYEITRLKMKRFLE
jgi:hypothetical protein